MKSSGRSAVTLAGAGALAMLLSTSAFAQSQPAGGWQRNGNDHGQNRTAARAPEQTQFNQQRQREQQTPQIDQRQPAQQSQRIDQWQRNEQRSNSWQQAGRSDQSRIGQQRETAVAQSPRSDSYRQSNRVDLSGRVQSFTRERDGYRIRLDNRSDSFWVPAARLRNSGRDLRVGLSIGFGGVFDGSLFNVDAVTYPYAYGTPLVSTISNGVLSGIVDRVDLRTGTAWLIDGANRIIAVDLSQTARSGQLDLRELRRGDALSVSGQWIGGSFAAFQIDGLNSGRY